ncbi:DUF1871 family protein [Planococcus salinus]
MNKRAVRILKQWDPFSVGEQMYRAEIEDAVMALQVLDDPSELAKKIRSIYGFSFNKWIPIEKCVDISYKLLALKYEAKHII